LDKALVSDQLPSARRPYLNRRCLTRFGRGAQLRGRIEVRRLRPLAKKEAGSKPALCPQL